eukprot:42286_1
MSAKKIRKVNKDKKLTEKWTNTLLAVIERKSTDLNLDGLTLNDVDNIPWELLIQCTSVTHLQLNSFPSNKSIPEYNTPSDIPQTTREETEELFPYQVYEMTNLTILDMNSYPFEYISPNIGKLVNLNKLSMTGSRIICIPSEIGKLTKLQYIAHYCSYSISWSPYEMINCQINNTYISRRPNYIYNSYLLPPLPKPINMKDIIRDLKQIFVQYGLIAGLVDVIVDYLPFKECSNIKCENKIHFNECIYYVWSMYKPGVDPICLLAGMCSIQCIESIEKNKRYYLGSIDKKYCNMYVNDDGKCVQKKSLRGYRKEKEVMVSLKEELPRFEYFWKYKLGIKYKSYELLETDQKVVMAVFSE